MIARETRTGNAVLFSLPDPSAPSCACCLWIDETVKPRATDCGDVALCDDCAKGEQVCDCGEAIEPGHRCSDCDCVGMPVGTRLVVDDNGENQRRVVLVRGGTSC